jgi:hypothetical protein
LYDFILTGTAATLENFFPTLLTRWTYAGVCTSNNKRSNNGKTDHFVRCPVVATGHTYAKRKRVLT